MSARRITRGLAVAVAVPTALVLSTSQALATTTALTADPVKVTNTETVQARLDPSGKVEGARIYEQLDFAGKGKVKLSNPVSTDGLRNLDGFGGPSVKDGKMNVDLTVDGEQRMRTVSDFDKKKLPIKVAVTYTLNGKKLKKPGDAVGKDGRLEAHYVVENTSAEPREVTITDGYGKKITEQSDVVIPMVGQLTTVLPPEFTDVSSNEANRAGDGKGGTKLSFTVTLFPPVGAATAEFGWAAEVKDAVVPEAELTALPVSPLDSPTFKAAVSGYESGAEKGSDLVEGGTTLDTNLIRLRDGAEKLLGGLLQLNAGAKTLNEGLANEAAPGASKLSDGAAQLAGGLGELDTGASLLRTKTGEAADGASKINDGAGKLNKGAKDLSAGANKLKAGTGELEGGLNKLKAGTTDLNAGAGKLKAGTGDLKAGAGKLKAGTTDLKAGAGKLKAGTGDLKTGAGKLKAGTGDLKTGAGKLKAGTGDLKAGTGKLASGLDEATGKAPSLIEGLNQVSAGLNGVEDGLVQMYGGIGQLPTKAQALHAGVKQLQDGIGSVGAEGTLLGGLESLKKQLSAAGPGIDKMRGGVDCASDALKGVSNGKAVGTYDEACYGPAAALLNGPAGALNAGPETNTVKKMILDSLIGQLGSINGSTPDLDKPLPDSATMQEALAYLKGRLTQRAVPGIAQLQCGLDNRLSGCPDSKPGLIQGLDAVDAGISQLVSSVVASVQGGIGEATDTPANKTLRGGVNGLQAGVGQIQEGGKTLLAGLNLLSDGADQLDLGAGVLDTGAGTLKSGAEQLDTGAGALKSGADQLDTGAGALKKGAGDLDAGAGALKKGAGDLDTGAGTLKAGVGKLDSGAGQLKVGAGALDNGAWKLAGGAGQLKAGVGVLVDGTGQLDSGLGKLADGTGKLADGVGKAKDGSDQVAQGSKDLSAGIGKAADGSGKLADGLETASQGGKAIPDGASRLSKEGAKELTKNGAATALDFGRRYGVLSASADRAKTESMPYGAPEGAVGATAYSLKLAGDSGEGGRSWVRLLLGLGVFGVAIGATGLLRRRFSN
ncbi:hypothetical protein GCM10009554_60730 [Kribbella koreensis]|uniref:X-X-X-Leu-X-X-Gly heptad repeat protein n=1 Tax=Kribbella koreensis TaxID=57909 RepID=A0ABP4BTH4_9ACTN